MRSYALIIPTTVAMLVAMGCGGSSSPTVADAGIKEEAGAAVDSSLRADSPIVVDSGVRADSAISTDVSAPTDSAIPIDAAIVSRDSDSAEAFTPEIIIAPYDGGAAICGDGEALREGRCQTCGSLQVKVQTQASCSLEVLNGFEMDGEGSITVEDQRHRIFAIDRWGAGHLIAWCDGTTNVDLVGAFDVRQYLAQKSSPKLGAFGYGVLCKSPYLPSDFVYLGSDLPTKYQGNAALLAADYDALVFCGFGVPWSWDWSQVLADYVRVHGRGLLLSMDYWGVPGAATTRDFEKTNTIADMAGLSFNMVKLDWAEATLDIDLACIPDLPIRAK